MVMYIKPPHGFADFVSSVAKANLVVFSVDRLNFQVTCVTFTQKHNETRDMGVTIIRASLPPKTLFLCKIMLLSFWAFEKTNDVMDSWEEQHCKGWKRNQLMQSAEEKRISNIHGRENNWCNQQKRILTDGKEKVKWYSLLHWKSGLSIYDIMQLVEEKINQKSIW